jgi:ABC-type Fe3+-hydroxamate transport system substrate-binding protein
MSDIATLDGAYDMMQAIGEITGREKQAKILIDEIKNSFEKLSVLQTINTCAYFIWRKPYMVAAKGTFIDEMMEVYGVKNVFADMNRYPEVTSEQIAAYHPDVIFLSSEPYAFSEKHISEFQAICPGAKVRIVDGEMFSWYGSRLRYAAAYFEKIRQEKI